MSWRSFILWSAVLLAACGGGVEGLYLPSLARKQGSRAFVSADDSLSRPWPVDWGRPRSLGPLVQEGALYRPLPGGRLLSFSHVGGLQVIDVSTPSRPSIVGRLPPWGDPVDARLIGDTAHLLLDCARCYFEGADGKTVELHPTGWLISVDLSDPTHPREVARTALPGRIVGSKLTRVGEIDVLHIGTDRWWQGTGGQATLGAFALSPKGSRLIGSRVLSEGTPILVGERSWFALLDEGTRRTLRAISTDGEGATITLAGGVDVFSHLHQADGILYAKSWDAPEHVLQTFDVSDPGHPRAVSRVSLDEARQVLFRDGAIFVLPDRESPLRVFTVSPGGAIDERDPIPPTAGHTFRFAHLLARGTRLLVFTSNGSSRMEARLYDVSDPDSAPLVVGKSSDLVDIDVREVQFGWRLSELTVVEEGPGTRGLALLPFLNLTVNGETMDGIQLLHFSDDGVASHGVLPTDTRPEHSFRAHGVTFVGSSTDLVLFDTSDPDLPQKSGSIPVALWLTDVVPMGNHRVQLTWRPAHRYVAELAVVDSGSATTLALQEVPEGSELRVVGDKRLAVVHTTWRQVEVQILDLGDPKHPKARGDLVLEWLGKDPDWPASVPWGDDHLFAAGETLVFVSEREKTEVVGEERFCRSWPIHSNECIDGTADDSCFVSGYQECVTRGETTRCEGGFSRCNQHGECIESRDVDLDVNCRQREISRTSREIEVRLVDTRDPDRPVLRQILRSPREEEIAGWFVDGSDLWISFKKRLSPHPLDEPLARFYTRRIGLSDPSDPVVGPTISLPGELVSVRGNRLVTRDRLWKDLLLEEGLAILRLEGGLAILESHRQLPGVAVESAHEDGRGRIAIGLTSFVGSVWEAHRTLQVLDAERLSLIDEVELEPWAALVGAAGGRAIVEAPSGAVVYELRDGPRPVAFLPFDITPVRFREAGDTLLFPGGRYGIHEVVPGGSRLPLR